MKKVNKFVVGYALVMFIITVITTYLLFADRYHLSFDLVNIITVGVILGMGYLVSFGLFFLELTKDEDHD